MPAAFSIPYGLYSALKYLQKDLAEAHKNNEKGIIVLFIICFLSFIVNAPPFITPEMNADFSAMGGIITLAAGLRMTRIKTDIRIINLLPSLPLAYLLSALWTALIG